jgi:DNA polymerase-3 subunit alpha
MFRIDADRLTSERATGLKALLGKHPGSTAVSLRAVIPAQTETTVSVPLKVQPADDLIEAARRLGFEVELR